MNSFELDLLKSLRDRVKESTYEQRIQNLLKALEIGLYNKEDETKVLKLLEFELSLDNSNKVLKRTK